MDDFKPRMTTSRQPQNQSEPQDGTGSEPPSTEQGDAPEADGAHIADIDLGDAPEANAAEPSAALAATTADGVLTREAFFVGFKGSLNIAAQLTKLQSLAVPEDDPGARPAADALYDTALDVPWLRFLIEPSNVWVQRSVVILAFVGPRAIAMQAELKARRAVTKGATKASGAPPAEEKPASNDNDPLAGFPQDAARVG